MVSQTGLAGAGEETVNSPRQAARSLGFIVCMDERRALRLSIEAAGGRPPDDPMCWLGAVR